jgi:predicted SAM-dependent methyltransferase
MEIFINTYQQKIKCHLPEEMRSIITKTAAAAVRLRYRSNAAKEYMKNNEIRKLQLGSGNNILKSWLNTDLNPNKDVSYLDVSKKMPFDEGSFDYVFSEHMIEHIDYQAGEMMFRECFRIMRPGGKIRIATPDLAVILGLYTSRKTREQEAYVRDMTDIWLKDAPCNHHTFVINNAVRAWGHKFIYDFETLGMALKRAGFTSIKRCKIGKSDDPHLNGIECREKNKSKDISRIETLIVEAEKA